MTWSPTASIDTLRLRARVLERLRAFFAERGVLEVETPILSRAATTEPHLASLATRYTGPEFAAGLNCYLHTSPEFPMKRLLAAGTGSIYQICKVFRDNEAGRLHNPEFTMLEWYRLGFDHHRLMEEVAELVADILGKRLARAQPEKLTYREAFRRHCGLDPHTASVNGFAECVRQHGISIPNGMPDHDLDPWRYLLLTHVVEPQLGRGGMTFLHEYPASQAAGARIRGENPPLAERFELYIEGIEIANGFHELGDADEQRERFDHDLVHRRASGLPSVQVDEYFLQSLKDGLPECSGVALGVDRLVMLATGARSIADVIAFPIKRA